MSLDYYNKHAKTFVQNTLNLDMSALLNRFIENLPTGASILDIGCGSGRDAKWLKERGFKVYAIDGSHEMVRLAQEILIDDCAPCLFEAFDPLRVFGKAIDFDGMWASASLIHVAEDELKSVINLFGSYLKKGGKFYMSFKKSADNYQKEGRQFTNMTQLKYKRLIGDCPMFKLTDLFESQDIREDKAGEWWINAILEKL
jgi:SAM-dependent methyltransferase